MYVCVCRAVTEEQVAKAIDAGVETVAGIVAACGAGDDCGACHGMIEEMIEERRARASRRSLPLVGTKAA
jgi:bacterioferritin-associated ferredoxin